MSLIGNGKIPGDAFVAAAQRRPVTGERSGGIHKQFVVEDAVPTEGGNGVTPIPVEFRMFFSFEIAAIGVSFFGFQIDRVIAEIGTQV
ncbi:hypothetical protein SDC9_100297 [bioreactor metagenome]|uniref:Uncharacterized protein n=1 Tax=bioreactor metagenome TaxID=1076179 RepID=A0A645AK43_9ZZZZ